MKWVYSLVVIATVTVSCGTDGRIAPLAEKGAVLASDPRVTRSQYNAFACTTCHTVRTASNNTRVLPGAPLQGVARRPTYWNGEVVHLREAVTRCWTRFMRGVATDLDGPNGEALDAWLLSISPENSTEGTAPVSMTWPRSVRDPGADGNATRGIAIWTRACSNCHGTFGAGSGRIGTSSPLPADTYAQHCSQSLATEAGYPDIPSYLRAIVAEKTRHGGFLAYEGGAMPPFSREVISDDDIRDIAAMFRCP
jgi:thiosulfate dehydrogenase